MPPAHVKEEDMDILYERVAGLDVHKDTVVACVRIVAEGKTKRECRTFSSTTEQLIELRAWLEECRCTHVAMEATGVYWMPVFRILGEGPFELMVANAAHIKNVPGRKTDVNDATWIAELAGKQIKATPKELYDALHGRLTDHHCFLLDLHLKQWDGLDGTIREIDREIDQRIGRLHTKGASGEVPFRTLIELLSTVPGISTLSASAIVSEIGCDMNRFPTAGHLVSWSGLCPGQNESAGKRKPSRLRKGAPWLKTMLVQCAWAAKRKKDSYYRAQFFRLQSKRGPQKAICAVAASLLTAIYHILKDGTEHHDLGAGYFDRRPIEVKASRLVTRLKKLGFEVQLQRTAEAA